jgi:hypothetical protein
MIFLCFADEVSTVEPWPKRLLAPSPRLNELGVDEKKYLSDTVSF